MGPNEADLNLANHKIDFADTVRVFGAAVVYTYRSDRHGEERYTAVALVDGRLIAVAYHDRIVGNTNVRRIISARRAQDREIKKYHAHQRQGG